MLGFIENKSCLKKGGKNVYKKNWIYIDDFGGGFDCLPKG
jgi:hypothetical protein